MYLRYTSFGWLYISPEDDCNAIVDAMLATDYSEEFCIAEGFDPEFTARLMEAGFLVMSINIGGEDEPHYLMLPKLHIERSVLFFENLHIKKSIRRLLNRYELRADVEFDRIIDRCVEKHDSDWLSPALVDCIKEIRRSALENAEADGGEQRLEPAPYAYPVSFALYRGEKLAAAEFGVVCGRVYTSYSGFYEEDNAGTVQIILTARYLQEHGFSFLDLGMPMEYKTALGAEEISPREFVSLFRS
jgi:Leu/Phe-tRNA-protein transferase